VPERYDVARLDGYDIRLAPLATLVRSDPDSVYGIVASATHEELRRLYTQTWVGTYLPHPVVVETSDGKLRPALCYIAPTGEGQSPPPGYIDLIIGPAKQHGFPNWYVRRLESLRT
jgi:hypothetical protein